MKEDKLELPRGMSPINPRQRDPILPMFASMTGTLSLESNDSFEIEDSWFWYVDYTPSFLMGPFASKELAQKDWDRVKRVEHNTEEQDDGSKDR